MCVPITAHSEHYNLTIYILPIELSFSREQYVCVPHDEQYIDIYLHAVQCSIYIEMRL